MGQYNCYISFCEKDVDRPDLQLFVSELRHRLPDVKFHVYYEEKLGSRFDEFMANLDTMPCAIVLFTPEYRRRTDDTRERECGVYKEYEKIASRIELQSTAPMKETPHLFVIPVLWKGADYSASLPKLFINQFAVDLTSYHAHRLPNGEYVVPSHLRSRVAEALDRIQKDILFDKSQIESEQSDAGQNLDRIMVRDAVIRQEADPETYALEDAQPAQLSMAAMIEEAFQPKYERQIAETARFRERYFVETKFYSDLKKQEHYIYSGRKGSGKTTTAQMLIFDNMKKYIRPIDVQVNDWRLHAIFDDYILHQISGDLAFIKSGVQTFELSWIAFVGFSIVRSLFEEKIISEKDFAQIFPNEIVRQSFETAIELYSLLFQLTLYSLKLFSDELINKAPRDNEATFRNYLRANFRRSSFVTFLFGTDAENLAKFVEKAIQNKKSRFLLCLDRFDTELQEYRKSALRDYGTERGDELIHRELNWLQGLVQVLNQCKSRDKLTPETEIFRLFQEIDFFVVLPRDRFREVQEQIRDSVIVDTGVDVRWKPPELLTMLRKRLELVANFDDAQLDRKTYRSAADRYNYIIKRYFGELPEKINVKIDHSTYEIDLFLGVLRHTFWRPRDIMIFFTPIIQRLVNYRAKGSKQFDAEIVKRIISQKTRDLVTTEFVQEFSDSFLNMRAVLSHFKAQPQVHMFDSIETLLSGVNFRIINQDPITSIYEKLHLLYDIGFIGLKPNRQYGDLSPTGDFTFSFMHRTDVVDFEATKMVEDALFAIHPVFIESLSLIPGSNPGGGGRPVSYFDWDFIEQNDILR